MPFPILPAAPKMSKTKALHEMCKQCIYDSSCPGTWREQVENCKSQHCPLWQHRPLTVATINANRKTKGGDLDISSVLDSIDDEDDEECLFPNGIPAALPASAA